MTSHKVILRNRDNRIIKVNEDQTILEACEAIGITLPVGCRYGGCVTCSVTADFRYDAASTGSTRESQMPVSNSSAMNR